MKIRFRIIRAGFCLLLGIATHRAIADVKLPAIFGDHMVLQQEAKIPVWGIAEAGEKVTVELGAHSASTTAAGNGAWRVNLDPSPDGSPATTLSVRGTNTLTFQDVVIGEVWLCSGQSNMEFALSGAHNANTEIPQADDPQLRLFTVKKRLSLEPLTALEGAWECSAPSSVKSFSAVGYFFGRELRAKLKRPVGLIGSYWGGSTAQSWTSLAGLSQNPPIQRYLDAHRRNLEEYAKLNDRYGEKEAAYEQALKQWQTPENLKAMAAWTQKVHEAQKNHAPMPPTDFPRKPVPPPVPGGDQKGPANNFNGMIAPLIPYAIKGVIWYQGEYNTDDPMEYYVLFPRLIQTWRQAWGEGDFPFLFVQLPALWPPNSDPAIKSDNWDLVREAQARTLALPRTAMAVSLDVGGGLHPPGKIFVGQRLALIARHQVYGGADAVDSGPTYRSVTPEGEILRIRFSQVHDGLTIGASPMAPDAIPQPKDRLSGFVIAGEDRQWHEAEARIAGDEVVVSSATVHKPAAVRYGWGNGAFDAQCNLYDRDGLPAAPFRTDDWDDVIPANARMQGRVFPPDLQISASPPQGPTIRTLQKEER